MTLTVRVTEAHIRAGDRGSCLLCPIARAVRDAVGAPCTVTVSVSADVLVSIGPERWAGDLPRETLVFLLRFDAGRPVDPIEFPLELRRIA